MYKFFGQLAVRHPWKICAIWLVLGLVVSRIAPKWEKNAQDDDIRFLPARCDSVKGYRLLEKAFPEDVYASKMIFALERQDQPLSKQDLKLAENIANKLKQFKEEAPELKLGQIYSHRDPYIGDRLLSKDKKCTLVTVALGSPYLALNTRTAVDRAEKEIQPLLAALGDEAPSMFITGPAGVGRDLTSAGANSLDHTTIATIILVIVILLMVYRSPVLALIPLVTIAICVWVALNILSLCTLIPGFHLVNVSRIFAIVMLYGAGTDYCLFLISRYREELAEGRGQTEALSRSVAKVGGALAASAGTVICGLGLMALAEFAKVRSSGPAIALSLSIALIGSLTLAPALLCLLGRIVFWPNAMPRPVATELKGQDLWSRLSRAVIKRPGWIWASAVIALLPLAFLGFRVQASYKATTELSQSSSSVKGLNAIQRHFHMGETGPITVLLTSKSDWDSKVGKDVVRHLSEGFTRLENVADVRSLTQPLGSGIKLNTEKKKSEKKSTNLFGGLANLFKNVKKGVGDFVAEKTAKKFYVSKIDDEGQRFVTRLDVVLRSDPFDAESVETMHVLQAWLNKELPKTVGPKVEDLQSEVYGVTVSSQDLALVTESDRKRINGLVLVGILLILLILVRKIWLAGYLLVTVLFSYYATLGATTILATWFFGRPMGVVDWRVPFFLFTILVAVGEDYNILLMTRAVKEGKRRGRIKGLEHALARTGGTITSCGLIMAGTFATLMLSGLGTLMQIGFALAFGVILDTFVVRPFLVPAFAVLVWRLWGDEEVDNAEESNERATIPMERPVQWTERNRAA